MGVMDYLRAFRRDPRPMGTFNFVCTLLLVKQFRVRKLDVISVKQIIKILDSEHDKHFLS